MSYTLPRDLPGDLAAEIYRTHAEAVAAREAAWKTVGKKAVAEAVARVRVADAANDKAWKLARLAVSAQLKQSHS